MYGNSGLVHFAEINQAPSPYSMLQNIGREATPTPDPRNCLRYLHGERGIGLRIYVRYCSLESTCGIPVHEIITKVDPPSYGSSGRFYCFDCDEIEAKNTLYFSYLAQLDLSVAQKDKTWLQKIAKIQ